MVTLPTIRRTQVDLSGVRAAGAAAARWLPSWRRTPFTISYLLVVGVGSVVLSLLGDGDHDAVLQLSSTDVQHLSTHPLFALIASALWVDGIGDYLLAALVLGVVCTALERRVGTRWVFAIFVSGHVVATLLTEGAVAVGVQLGVLSPSALSRLDVGVSYGLAAVLAASAGLLPRQVRVVGVLAAWSYLGWPVLTGHDMTACGHVIAVAVGVCWWPWLKRRGVAMMETWSMSHSPARSWWPRLRSTTPTSPAPSSCSSTTAAKAPSASS